EKCGSATAFGLARCGFGDELLEAAQNFQGKAFDDFLLRWRIELQHELESNSRGMLHSRQPQLAGQIPDSFPNRDIIQLYVDPLTSWSTPQNIPDTSSWKSKEPCIVELVKFCVDNFNWKTSQLLRKKFNSILWEGIFLQMLYSPLALYDATQNLLRTPNTKSQIIKATTHSRKGRFALMMGPEPQGRLVVATGNFVSLMGAGLMANESDEIVVWAPLPLLP
ncbi:hypothetical protein BYT27DRAFT_7010473, partial [Phlegmacium glaucopus]